MKVLKGFVLVLIAATLALTVSACGGSDKASTPEDSVVPFEKTSGAVVNLTKENSKASVDVKVAAGEALVIMSKIDSDSANEIVATTFKDGAEYCTDSFYGGYGYSEGEVDPGDYRVDIDAGGETGTMWVIAYPANAIDVANMETEDIINTVVSNIS